MVIAHLVQSRRAGRVIRRVLQEPLTWFILIGVLLFAADRMQAPDPVIVDDSVRSRIASLWQAQMGKPPSADELQSLVENWVREEVFFREALRLGLDRDDTIVRRRLVQKLGFIAEEVDESDVTAAEIQAFYDEHITEYTLPVRYSLSQVFFKDAARAEQVLPLIAGGDDWRQQGDASLLPGSFVAKSEREIASAMGTEFVSRLPELVVGQWVGPISSTYGFHLVRLEKKFDEAVTPLVHIEQQVMNDLLRSRRESAREAYYQELLESYRVEYR